MSAVLTRAAAPAGSPLRPWSQQWQMGITPWTVSPDHPDPARRSTFYVGVGHPNWLNDSPVPLFLSATTLAAYKSQGDDFPVQMGNWWAGDSGAYTALTTDNPAHPWHMDYETYGSMWVCLMDDIGPPDFVAIQDWPCEPGVLALERSTVADHQAKTLESYLRLSDEFPMVPWLRVLQGWHPWEYEEHYAMYERAGVEMRGQQVGIGSVCRRGSQTAIARVLGTLAPLGMRMHGFGVSVNGLRLAGHLLDSADSQAWSTTARLERLRLDGCEHMSRPDAAGQRQPSDCRNCFRWALAYREEVMDALREGAGRRQPEGQESLVDMLAELGV